MSDPSRFVRDVISPPSMLSPSLLVLSLDALSMLSLDTLDALEILTLDDLDALDGRCKLSLSH